MKIVDAETMEVAAALAAETRPELVAALETARAMKGVGVNVPVKARRPVSLATVIVIEIGTEIEIVTETGIVTAPVVATGTTMAAGVIGIATGVVKSVGAANANAAESSTRPAHIPIRITATTASA